MQRRAGNLSRLWEKRRGGMAPRSAWDGSYTPALYDHDNGCHVGWVLKESVGRTGVMMGRGCRQVTNLL